MRTGWHIGFGVRDPHLRELRRLAERNKPEEWTITSAARPGDHLAFYLKRPDAAVIAVGTVLAVPKKQQRGPWRGHYMARVAGIRMLPQPVGLEVLRRRFPAWGWPRFPRRSTTVPPHLAERFAKLLPAPPAPGASSFDLAEREGAPVEYTAMRRGRSRRLRDLALEQAKGVCASCGRDFSKVLAGLGGVVLQVHHRKQLAASSAPRVTRLDDLGVLCANCHRLIHVDPYRALAVDELRLMIRADGNAQLRA